MADGAISGSAVWHTAPVMSVLTGWVEATEVHIERVDTNGFRGIFDGEVSSDGTVMSGTGANDPDSPGGNNAQYTWTAKLQ